MAGFREKYNIAVDIERMENSVILSWDMQLEPLMFIES